MNKRKEFEARAFEKAQKIGTKEALVYASGYTDGAANSMVSLANTIDKEICRRMDEKENAVMILLYVQQVMRKVIKDFKKDEK